MKITRHWCMPNSETFNMKPIIDIFNKYKVFDGKPIIVDPFARNSMIATITNDLNTSTNATYHMHAIDFCKMLVDNNTKADFVFFDPPYSPRQIKECYNNIGIKMTKEDGQIARMYKDVKKYLAAILKPGGISFSFGWNSCGLGIKNNMEAIEYVILCHGGGHNDTIISVEKKKI